jgi:hypothetical protein
LPSLELVGGVPARLIEDEQGVSSGRKMATSDRIEMHLHDEKVTAVSRLVAFGETALPLDTMAVILDQESGKAVVCLPAKGLLGIKGSSYLAQCH